MIIVRPTIRYDHWECTCCGHKVITDPGKFPLDFHTKDCQELTSGDKEKMKLAEQAVDRVFEKKDW